MLTKRYEPSVVIFDGQLLLPYADEAASYVQTLGKPVDRIILSHAHALLPEQKVLMAMPGAISPVTNSASPAA